MSNSWELDYTQQVLEKSKTWVVHDDVFKPSQEINLGFRVDIE